MPRLGRLLEVTVRPRRGLFYATPAFALLLVGLGRLRGAVVHGKPELVAAAAGVVVYFGLIAGLIPGLTVAFPFGLGGSCIGPRYFTPALPLALLLLGGGTRTTPRLFALLAALSTLLMFVATLTEPLPAPRHANPFRDVLFPMLLHNGLNEMRNVFTHALGTSLMGALLAYLALWAAVAMWLGLRLRGYGRAARG